MTKKVLTASKGNLDVLKKFANWSNSFQVFDDGRFEVGFLPDNSLSHLMVAEGWLKGEAPPPGHYSTRALKEQGKYVIEENPFFNEPFAIEPNIDSEELAKFSIPARVWRVPKENSQAFLSKVVSGSGSEIVVASHTFVPAVNARISYNIIPISDAPIEYFNDDGSDLFVRNYRIDAEGHIHDIECMMPKKDEAGHTFKGVPWEIGQLSHTFTVFPKANVKIQKPFMIRSAFVKAMPTVDYRVTVFENHVVAFESIEHDFAIYLRGWIDEDHEKMQPYRSQDDDWLVGGTKQLIEQFEKVHGKTELIKIK